MGFLRSTRVAQRARSNIMLCGSTNLHDGVKPKIQVFPTREGNSFSIYRTAPEKVEDDESSISVSLEAFRHWF